jgi:hypothetical protein
VIGALLTYLKRRSELCMTVESIFSHAWLYRFHGTNSFADLAELATFNALPAGVTADCKYKPRASEHDSSNRGLGWAHNYIHQTNQPWANELDTSDNPWYNVGNYGLAYGLEPNYVSDHGRTGMRSSL